MNAAADSSVAAALDRAGALVRFDRHSWRVGETHRGTTATDLADALYERWYTQPSTPAPPVSSDPPLVRTSLVSALRAAHASAGRLSEGWVVTHVHPTGGLSAVRGAAGRAVQCGDYVQRARAGVPPAPGEPIALVERLDHVDAERGVWWTFSDPRPDAAIGRAYFNVRAATAPRALHHITRALTGLAFQLKCPVYTRAYDRVDAMVLYYERDARDEVLAVLDDVWPTLGPLLDPAVPPLTGYVRPGLAIADEFDSERSYGETRCHLLTAAMIACRNDWRERDSAQRRAVLLSGLADAGLDVDRPWLQTP
jgi:hypothetical protein